MATYIPQLAAQNPKHWGIAACSVDGHQYQLGDAEVPFCVQVRLFMPFNPQASDEPGMIAMIILNHRGSIYRGSEGKL